MHRRAERDQYCHRASDRHRRAFVVPQACFACSGCLGGGPATDGHDPPRERVDRPVPGPVARDSRNANHLLVCRLHACRVFSPLLSGGTPPPMGHRCPLRDRSCGWSRTESVRPATHRGGCRAARHGRTEISPVPRLDPHDCGRLAHGCDLRCYDLSVHLFLRRACSSCHSCWFFRALPASARRRFHVSAPPWVSMG